MPTPWANQQVELEVLANDPKSVVEVLVVVVLIGTASKVPRPVVSDWIAPAVWDS
jgi:hypothetical protein